MSNTKHKTEAQRLADELEDMPERCLTSFRAAVELRRLDSENAKLREAIKETEQAAVLSAAPQAPAPVIDIATSIHYPECWDTAAYPTVESALHELQAWFAATPHECWEAPAPAQWQDLPYERRAALISDWLGNERPVELDIGLLADYHDALRAKNMKGGAA